MSLARKGKETVLISFVSFFSLASGAARPKTLTLAIQELSVIPRAFIFQGLTTISHRLTLE
jgi:hypothetical protein